MKAYAQSTPGVEAASFGYDPTSYQPTYRLELGKPGRSLALEMAERLGLPAEVVKDARARRDDKDEQAEALLARLEREKAAQDLDRERLDGLKAEAEEALARPRPPSARSRRRSAARWRSSPRSSGGAPRRRSRRPPRRSAKPSRSSKPRARPRPPRRGLKSEAVAKVRDAHEAVLKDPRARAARGAGGPLAPGRGGNARAFQAYGGDRRGDGAPGRQGRAGDLGQTAESRRPVSWSALADSNPGGAPAGRWSSSIVPLRASDPSPTPRSPCPPSST